MEIAYSFSVWLAGAVVCFYMPYIVLQTTTSNWAGCLSEPICLTSVLHLSLTFRLQSIRLESSAAL